IRASPRAPLREVAQRGGRALRPRARRARARARARVRHDPLPERAGARRRRPGRDRSSRPAARARRPPDRPRPRAPPALRHDRPRGRTSPPLRPRRGRRPAALRRPRGRERDLRERDLDAGLVPERARLQAPERARLPGADRESPRAGLPARAPPAAPLRAVGDRGRPAARGGARRLKRGRAIALATAGALLAAGGALALARWRSFAGGAGDGARAAPVAPAARADRPDVLLVTVDTLRADHVGAYGYARATSPHLDALARQGALFEVAYSPMGATGPAHATLFTSRQPIAHGVGRNGVPLPDDLPTLAGLLTAAGYRSAAFVSAFPVASRFGFGRGFEHYDDAFGPSGGTVSWRRRWRRRGATGAFDRRGAETVDRALAWLGASARDRPRFLWVHLFDPHEPYDAPAPWDRAFARPDAATRERAIDAYDGEILYADAQLGRLIAAFDALAPGGLLVLAADHGEGLWDHGVAHHGRTLFEEEVRVPLVVRWPGRVAAGARVPQPAHLIDVLPTIAGAAGVAIAGGGARFDGVDLIAAL